MQIQVDTFGMVVSCHNSMFAVGGQQLKTTHLPVRKVSSIRIGPGVRITSDAILLALEHSIPVLFVARSGIPKGHIWHGKFGSIVTIRKKQLRFAESLSGMHWVKQCIVRKMQNQQAFAYALAYQNQHSHRETMLKHIQTAERTKQQFERFDLDQINLQEVARTKASWRGWEGTVSRYYFQVLALAVPPSYHFTHRSGRFAKDRFNCLLNYCYGILYGQVELALIKAGIDPAIGVFHVDQYNKPTLVFDLIEPFRIWAETVAIRLCHAQLLNSQAFEQHEKGLWLSNKGKPYVIEYFFEYFKAPAARKGKQFSREALLDFECQQFAKKLLQWNE